MREINALEPEIEALSDDELRAKTTSSGSGSSRARSSTSCCPRRSPCVREAAKRTLGMRHFDVQLIGGMVLHEGRIAEMKTGEGKTLVATLPLYLNALAGVNVHLVTVNDYLATPRRRLDGPVYEALGITVGVIQSNMDARSDRAPRRLRLRHHLRHQLRVRLRLPARQHGRRADADRPARPLLRDRGRGRLDPDRRGAHAADHLRPARAGGRDLLRVRPHRARPRASATTTRSTRSSRPRRRPRRA